MRFASLFLPAAVSCMVASCSHEGGVEGPTGPASLALSRATVITDNVRIPVNILVFIPCANGGAGEFVELTGNLHVLVHVTLNGSRAVVKTHFQPQGISGTGMSTGDKYHGTGVTQDLSSGSLVNGQLSYTLVNNFRIIGQGPGNNLLIHERFHVTVNSNGEVAVLSDLLRVDCA